MPRGPKPSSALEVRHPHVGWWIVLVGGLIFMEAYHSFILPAYPHGAAWWPSVVGSIRKVAYFLHVAEGLYAAYVAGTCGLSAVGYGVQTLIVGFPSLMLLNNHKRELVGRRR